MYSLTGRCTILKSSRVYFVKNNLAPGALFHTCHVLKSLLVRHDEMWHNISTKTKLMLIVFAFLCYFVITLHLLSTFSSHSCSYYVPWSEYWQWNGELQLWLDYSLWLRHSCHIHLQCWLFPEWSSHQDLWWRWVLNWWTVGWDICFMHRYNFLHTEHRILHLLLCCVYKIITDKYVYTIMYLQLTIACTCTTMYRSKKKKMRYTFLFFITWVRCEGRCLLVPGFLLSKIGILKQIYPLEFVHFGNFAKYWNCIA